VNKEQVLSKQAVQLGVRTEDKREHWEKVDSVSRKRLYSLLGLMFIAGLVMFPLAAFGRIANNTALFVLGGLGFGLGAVVVLSNHIDWISDRVGTPWVKASIAHWRNVFRFHSH